jgi:hypothetical protein
MKISKPFILICVVVLLASLMYSCSKKNGAPIIVIAKPVSNDTIITPDTLTVQGVVTDDKSLHQMSIIILTSIGDTVFQEQPYVHNLKTYSFKYDILITDTISGTYSLHVAAEDHDLAVSEKTLTVVLK